MRVYAVDDAKLGDEAVERGKIFARRPFLAAHLRAHGARSAWGLDHGRHGGPPVGRKYMAEAYRRR